MRVVDDPAGQGRSRGVCVSTVAEERARLRFEERAAQMLRTLTLCIVHCASCIPAVASPLTPEARARPVSAPVAVGAVCRMPL
jgi:hypothetical protein